MNEDEKKNNMPLYLTINKNEKLSENCNNSKNFRYVALSKIYHELQIDNFIINKFKSRKFSEFKLNNVIKLLTFSRALFSDSKKSTFENNDFSL